MDSVNVEINVDMLGKDPEEDKKLFRFLKIKSYLRNTMPLEEFNSKYATLFQKVHNVDPTALRQLSQDYMMRIDPYNPVYIVKDMNFPTVEELLGDENVVMILPAIYNRLGTVNNVRSKDGVEIGLEKMQAFNNIVALDIVDPFDKKKIRYSEELKLILGAMTDPDELRRNKEVALKMAEDALKTKPVKDTSERSDDEILAEYQEMMDTADESSTPKEHEEFL